VFLPRPPSRGVIGTDNCICMESTTREYVVLLRLWELPVKYSVSIKEGGQAFGPLPNFSKTLQLSRKI